MKKFIYVLLSISLFGLSLAAQTDNPARPRTAPTPLPNPQAKRPPVLIGGATVKTTPTPTPTPDKQETADSDDEVIKIETNLVTIPVTVLDRDGRFISGLRQQDFQIFEDNVPQKIDTFTTVQVPFTVVLLLDVSPSTQYQITEIQDAAIAFVNQLRQDDRVMVVSFDEHINILSPLTNNRNQLRNAILEANFGEGTSLYEAVGDSLNRELAGIEGRKAVVLFTDGVDTMSRRATYESTVRDAEETEALIYPIHYDTFDDAGVSSGGGYPNQYPRRRGGILGQIMRGGNVTIGGYPQGGSGVGSRQDYERGARYLDQLARNSGGRVFEANATNNLDAAFSGIAEELRRQYSIGYYPETVGNAGQRKQIKVRVNRANAVVRAKNSYIVGSDSVAPRNAPSTAQTTSRPTVARPTPRVTTAGRLPF